MTLIVKVSKEQWDAVEMAQKRHGVADKLVARMLGCGDTTVRTHRTQGGWTIRILPEGFMTKDMLRQTGAADLGGFDLFGEDGDQPVLDDAALRRALDRLMTLIVNETARVGMGALDPLALKRLEVMSIIARSFEKLMELKAKLAPPAEISGDAVQTAKVLKEMNRRVDEMVAVRAQEIIDHHCTGGTCGARQFAEEVARSAMDG